MTSALTRSTCTQTTSRRIWARRVASPVPCFDHLVDRLPREVGAAPPAELSRAEDAAPAQVGREVGVACNLLERLTPRLRAVRRHDQARVTYNLGQARRVRHDNRRAARHRFQRRKAEALVPGRV